MTEAETGLPQTTEQALSLSKVRLDASAPKPATPKATESPEQPAQAQAAADSEAGTKPNGQSAPKKADFSFVADPRLRAALEANNLPDDAAQALRDWTADYTKKSQRAKEYEQKAQAWDAIESLPNAKRVIADLIASADAPPAPEPEPEFDYSAATSAEIKAHIREEIRKGSREVAETLLRERVLEPVSNRQQILTAAAGLYGEWKERLDESAFKAAWSDAVGHYGETAFTPDNVDRLFVPFLKSAAAERELMAFKGKKTQDAEVARRATSPAGTSSVAATAPSGEGAEAADGRTSTARARTLKMLRERFGWDERDLEASAKT